MEAVLYLIPAPLGDEDLSSTITPYCMEIMQSLDYFVVEEERTARRYLSKIGRKGQMDSLWFKELNEHSTEVDTGEALQPLLQGHSLGLLSEAGLPAVADPGADLVALAHEKDIKVVPLSGPSSLFMALMASGMNGQRFAFNGYLPVKREQRNSRIRFYESRSRRESQTQLFIETPYRNAALLQAFIDNCSETTRLCLAAGIGQSEAYVKSASIGYWKRRLGPALAAIAKKPCVFLIYA